MSRVFTLTLRHGIQLASRKGFMTFTSVLVLFIASTILVGSLLMQSLFASAVTAVEKRVDMNVFMLPGTSTETVNSLMSNLETLPEIKSLELTTADQALVEFRERHADDYLTLQALDELDNNPLGAIVSVQANDPAAYEVVARYLSTDNQTLSQDIIGSIEKINYFENKAIIERLSNLQENIHAGMTAVLIVAIILAVLMVGAVVRSVVYALREEVALLRALGSSTVFIYGQFIVAYTLYAALATLLSLAVGYALSVWMDAKLATFAPGVSVSSFMGSNILQIIGITLSVACMIGWVASFISVQLSLGKSRK